MGGFGFKPKFESLSNPKIDSIRTLFGAGEDGELKYPYANLPLSSNSKPLHVLLKLSLSEGLECHYGAHLLKTLVTLTEIP